MKPRIIKLFCPSVSKTVPFVAWDEQRLNLGSIAWTFGLDPATLKLNGHFVSRGVDLFASSVTWNSLLSFFSARGLSTGKDDQDALVVDGKLIRVGTKRAHDPRDAVDGSCCVAEDEVEGGSRRPQPEDVYLVKNKRLKERNSGEDLHGRSFKRKQLLEDLSLVKKLKINETDSGHGNQVVSVGFGLNIGAEMEALSLLCVSMASNMSLTFASSVQGNDHNNTFACSQFTCCYMSNNLKRMREDEAIAASPCKRIR